MIATAILQAVNKAGINDGPCGGLADPTGGQNELGAIVPGLPQAIRAG
jgi:hypothetical protein